MAAKKKTTKKSAAKKPVKAPAKAAPKPAKAANKTTKVAKKTVKKAAAKVAKASKKAAVGKQPAKAAGNVRMARQGKTAKSAKSGEKPVSEAPKTEKPRTSAAKPKPTGGDFATAPSKPRTNGSHNAAFVEKQRKRLLDLRDELVDSMSGMTRDTIRNAPEGSEASGSGQHQGDAGSDAYDRDFALSVLAKEQDALYEIEQALRRIQSGAYGICEMSSNKIPQARLEAIPFARLTVECQAQWEKEYGKRRFRPSNEVGFSGGNRIDDEDSDAVSLDEEED